MTDQEAAQELAEQVYLAITSRHGPSAGDVLLPLVQDAARYRDMRDHDRTDLYCSWIDEMLNAPEAEPAEFDAAIDKERAK